jgi:hypothetical protein
MPSGQDAPAREVVAWRERQLLDSGFDAALAARLALDCAFDLHALVELVERGCPHETAARILAPLPGERKPC